MQNNTIFERRDAYMKDLNRDSRASIINSRRENMWASNAPTQTNLNVGLNPISNQQCIQPPSQPYQGANGGNNAPIQWPAMFNPNSGLDQGLIQAERYS